MNRFRFFAWIAAAALGVLAAGCAAPSEHEYRPVTQVASIDGLLAGVYDGTVTLGELKQYGNFGIGTFSGLDGEMILLDGTVYQASADKTVYCPGNNITTPFAAVIDFTPDAHTTAAEPMTLDEMKLWLDQQIPGPNTMAAIRLHGIFPYVRTRSVPKQTPPYRPLAEVTRNQPEFERRNVAGTVVGYRLPPLIRGLNVPGYHLHFLSDDRTFGGHLLELRSSGAVTAELQYPNALYVLLDNGDPEFQQVDFSRNRTEELKQVEQSPAAVTPQGEKK